MLIFIIMNIERQWYESSLMWTYILHKVSITSYSKVHAGIFICTGEREICCTELTWINGSNKLQSYKTVKYNSPIYVRPHLCLDPELSVFNIIGIDFHCFTCQFLTLINQLLCSLVNWPSGGICWNFHTLPAVSFLQFPSIKSRSFLHLRSQYCSLLLYHIVSLKFLVKNG